MKLFKHLLVAPAVLGLIAPVHANELNFDDISNYSELEEIDLNSNSFDSLPSNNQLLISGGEGLVDSHDHGDSFSTTTAASFGADFVIGAVDGAGSGKEAVTFNYQYGMNLSTSFTGEDSLALSFYS